MSLTLASSRTATAIGGLFADVLNRQRSNPGGVHRTGASVRRDSLEEGTFEDAFFTVPGQGEPDRLTHAARRLLDKGRHLRRDARGGRALSVVERAISRLTSGSVRVYEEICTLARLCAGRVYPSYEHLADATGLGRTTVARALTLLEAAGLLIRQRRFKKVGGIRPRYEQTSNVYRPVLAKGLVAYLPRWMRPAPLPDDELQREGDRQDETCHMLLQLNCRELARATLSGPLADVFAKLGACIDVRTASAETVLNR